MLLALQKKGIKPNAINQQMFMIIEKVIFAFLFCCIENIKLLYTYEHLQKRNKIWIPERRINFNRNEAKFSSWIFFFFHTSKQASISLDE